MKIAARREPDWSSAAASALGGRLPRFDHCLRMYDRFGMIEFAHGDVPDLSSGYCLDDNARALIVAVLALSLDPHSEPAMKIGRSASRFVQVCQRLDGAFHNRMDISGAFTDEIGSPDCIGRAAWACGVTIQLSPVVEWTIAAEQTLERATIHLRGLDGLRPRAYALLGLCYAASKCQGARDLAAVLAGDLADEFETAALPDWPWWEPELTWANARVPEAMLRAFEATGMRRFRDIGMRSLAFLTSVTQPDDMFVPIGNKGWYVRGRQRARYDQQPIDACAMVDMWLAAAEVERDQRYRERALDTFEWFFGNNTQGLTVAEPRSGGCHDGLLRGRLNQNMGAESTLSYLHAHLSIARSI